ncbi:MAG: MarR family transcriptional regulator [Enhydrobacter sp.]|nr:MAG: MarR family transcriptional regulator [Enhydrobacter sp.]
MLAQLVSESLHDLYGEPFGLSVTQWRVMAALGRFGPLTASDIGQRIVVDKVAVSRAVAGLWKRRLVERTADHTDRRRTTLTLSASGRAMHARIVPMALAYETKLFEALTGDERRTFEVLADRLFARARAVRL